MYLLWHEQDFKWTHAVGGPDKSNGIGAGEYGDIWGGGSDPRGEFDWGDGDSHGDADGDGGCGFPYFEPERLMYLMVLQK